MAVTESDLDPKPRKMPVTFLITMRKISPACDLVAKMLLSTRGLLYLFHPKKSTLFNMAVTESDLDSKPRKMLVTFLITVRKISPACDLVAKMQLSPDFDKTIFSPWLFKAKS